MVYGILRTKDAITPSLVSGDVLFSLLGYIVVYGLFVSFGTLLYLQAAARRAHGARDSDPGRDSHRPMAFADDAATATGNQPAAKG